MYRQSLVYCEIKRCTCAVLWDIVYFFWGYVVFEFCWKIEIKIYWVKFDGICGYLRGFSGVLRCFYVFFRCFNRCELVQEAWGVFWELNEFFGWQWMRTGFEEICCIFVDIFWLKKIKLKQEYQKCLKIVK